ncbi:unnamed protein product [Symbiodinium sp. CCMP2592]|nr:unnamed protein product [Symbiodinium sp. CCMP2592]
MHFCISDKVALGFVYIRGKRIRTSDGQDPDTDKTATKATKVRRASPDALCRSPATSILIGLPLIAAKAHLSAPPRRSLPHGWWVCIAVAVWSPNSRAMFISKIVVSGLP